MESFTEGINIGSEYGRIRIRNGSEGNGDLQSYLGVSDLEVI